MRDHIVCQCFQLNLVFCAKLSDFIVDSSDFLSVLGISTKFYAQKSQESPGNDLTLLIN